MHIHYYKPLTPPFLRGVITTVIEHAVCQRLTPVAELGCLTSKHHWSANWGGGDTRCCSVFFSAEGRVNMLQHCCSGLHHSLYVHHPFFLSSSSLPFISRSLNFPFHLQQSVSFECQVRLKETSLTTAPLLFRNTCSAAHKQ